MAQLPMEHAANLAARALQNAAASQAMASATARVAIADVLPADW